MADEKAEGASAPLLPGGHEAPPQYSAIGQPQQGSAYPTHPPPDGHAYPPHPPPDGHAYPTHPPPDGHAYPTHPPSGGHAYPPHLPPDGSAYPPRPPPGHMEPGPTGKHPVAPGYVPAVPSAVPGPTPGSVQVTTTVIAAPNLGIGPALVNCPHCHQNVSTTLEYVSGTLTIIIALVLCFFGLIFGCCLLPFCIDGCKDIIHTCPACGNVVGRFKRI